MPGGVCAVLDYEVDLMTEYIAEMATRLVTPGSTLSSPFRKFVKQILTSTRLPSTTILLGMNYLAKRINAMKGQGETYKASEGQVWRYLTVSLLLGSKFLDDNTFQNRSWSEVSGISVAELNSLEFDWVQAMNWRLYVNLDLSKDYQAWLDSWRDYRVARKRLAAQVSRERLAAQVPAIDTELSRYNSSCHSPNSRYLQAQAAEYERYQSLKAQQQYQGRDAIWQHNPWNAPLTPPDSGYGTPDYDMSATSSNARYNEWFSDAATQYANRYPQSAAPSQYYPNRQAPFSAYPYHHSGWGHAMGDCGCAGCAAPIKSNSYFAAPGYGQPVMG
ncbi:cyclin-like protein (Clg1), putative [Cordyceps militaris CM01]|uniref:Cyclin-like protein (Clg1), putative n=1 Tax=Cordyceps militaris (strain CM01) TaxID=983644 RepID=G3JLN2_CORMM|nr:cyclin-like protein (Clg1), putative [Cordyceps militaris CM01]EGX90606.1 cyclin-like protein (Clg1), putative [Cordyceps militaris CM01]